ncbi:MAG: glutathione S-transferase family protein [Candidatus Lambdaproteobacteria bacterium]|nr:glutathione S-transferase family protein [Candidatus Lambdaproteobacteria bacterium]
MITLYHWWVSSHSFKTRLVLAEKGLGYQEVLIDLGKRVQKEPWYLKIHPYGTVPAIEDDGFIVYDSTMIAEYLEEQYPQVPMLPKDARGRARIRMLEDFRDMHVHPVFRVFLQEYRSKPAGQADMGAVNKALEQFHGMLGRLERELEGREYLGGTFSIADTAFVPYFPSMDAWKIPVPESCPNVKAWIARCKARPSFAKSLAPKA